MTMTVFSALAEDGSAPWPINRLAVALNRMSADSGTNCVLLATGAMSPVHRGHVEILEHARKTLEERQGFAVLASFLSPSHDLYVGPKANYSGTSFAAAKHRIEMARLAVADHDWIEVATWEARVPDRWPDYPEVMDALQAFLGEQFGPRGEDILVFYVCGSDHLRYCKEGFGKPHQGLIAVPRDEEDDAEERPERLIFSTTPPVGIREFSSTAIRDALASESEEGIAEAERMLGPEVFAYARAHRLYCGRPEHDLNEQS